MAGAHVVVHPLLAEGGATGMTRLAVLADLHADDFGSRIDPATGLNARFADILRVVRWAADDATERGCDALVVAGDFTESRHPAPWRVSLIAEALNEFIGPQILVRGNHDGMKGDRSIVDLLAEGRRFHGELPAAWRRRSHNHEVAAFSRPGWVQLGSTAICATPYMDRSWLRTQPGMETAPDAEVYGILADRFLAIARGLYAEVMSAHAAAGITEAVLVIHQGLSGGAMSDQQQAFLGDLSLVVDTRALAAIGFRAIVAGHFHKHQVLSEQPLVLYAGAPYRTDFGEQDQEKVYVIVDTEAGTFEAIPTPARRFVTIKGEDLGVEPVNIEGAIVRVRDLAPEYDPAKVRADLEQRGAFEVHSIERRRVDGPVIEGGLAESLSPTQALDAYFAEDPDRVALLERGRDLIGAAA